MSSGGGGQQATSQTTTGPPAWLQPYQKGFMANVGSQVTQDLQSGYPSGLNQQVAPFTPGQRSALGQGQGLYQNVLRDAYGVGPQAQSLANQGASTLGQFASGGLMESQPLQVSGGAAPVNANLNAYASGQMMGPNPYLNSYYNQAALPLVSNYQSATAPMLAAQFQQAGAFNSPGYNQASGLAQQGLGQSLATLGANIYEPAYQQESANRLAAAQSIQQNAMQGASLGLQGQIANQGANQQAQEFGLGQRFAAAQGMPGAVQGLYQPATSLAGLGSSAISGMYGLGSAQQQQQQNQLNASRSNTAQAINYPFALLSQLGGALGQAALGGGTTTAVGPAPGGGGGLFGK